MTLLKIQSGLSIHDSTCIYGIPTYQSVVSTMLGTSREGRGRNSDPQYFLAKEFSLRSWVGRCFITKAIQLKDSG